MTKTPAVRPGTGENARRQRKTVKRMTELELLSGLTPEEYERRKREAKRRVFERYGIAP